MLQAKPYKLVIVMVVLQLAVKLLTAYTDNAKYKMALEMAEQWRSKFSLSFSLDASEKTATLERMIEE